MHTGAHLFGYNIYRKVQKRDIVSVLNIEFRIYNHCTNVSFTRLLFLTLYYRKCCKSDRLVVFMMDDNFCKLPRCGIILHLINSSNERPLFVPRDRPIFSRIGSKKVRIFSYWAIRCKCTLPLFFNDKSR